MQRAVVAAQLNKAIVEMSKQAILRQGRQGAEHAAKGDVAAGLEMGRGSIQKTECRQDALVRPGARRAHFSRGIFNGPSGPVGGNGRLESCGFIRGEPVDGLRGGQVGGNGRLESRGFIRCCRPRFAWAGLGQSSLLERLAERVEFKAQVLGDFSSAPTSPQQLLCLGGDLRRHHRSTACRTRCVERFHAPGTILVDATNDAVLRDAEGPHDIDLAARTHADQLGSEHLKSAAFVLGMLKQGLSAQK